MSYGFPSENINNEDIFEAIKKLLKLEITKKEFKEIMLNNEELMDKQIIEEEN